MSVDLRIPTGMMFTLMGAVLMAFGLSTNDNTAMYVKCQGVNVNMWCGIGLLVFGLVIMTFGRRGQMAIEKSRNAGTRD